MIKAIQTETVIGSWDSLKHIYKPAIEEQKHIQQILFHNEAINRLHILSSKQKLKSQHGQIKIQQQ